MRWLVYALGGGLGHLTRALALARAAARQGVATKVLSQSPFAPFVRTHLRDDRWAAEIELSVLETAGAEGTRELVGRALRSGHHDALVVDTFPRGLLGELEPYLDRPAFLVHRDLDPRYVQAQGLARLVPRYQGVLLPGEAGPLAAAPWARVAQTAPWLCRDADELLSPAEARRVLSAGDLPVALVVGSGNAHEVRGARALADTLAEAFPERLAVRLAAPGLSGGPPHTGALGAFESWPLLPLLTGVDLVVGAGGYHTVYEARAVGARLLAFARPRTYDRQQHRLRPDERVRSAAEVIEAVGASLDAGLPVRAAPRFDSGARQAVDVLLRWLTPERGGGRAA